MSVKIGEVIFAEIQRWGCKPDILTHGVKPLDSNLIRNYPIRMKYQVILIPSDEGFAVSCPALPGCWSQGKTQAEALANIHEAIQLWLEVAEENARAEAGREAGTLAEVTV
jgi:predicted RNase H-like HicB family nuclease